MAQLLFSTAVAGKIITAFSWMLVHSIWQGLLFSIICGVLLMMTRKASAAYRYNIALGLLMLFITACGFTFWYELGVATAVAKVLAGVGINTAAVFAGDINVLGRAVKSCSDYFTANAPLIALCWLVIFALKSVRIMGGVVYNQRIKNRYTYQPDAQWIVRIENLAEKLQINKKITLLGSGQIKMPVVIGHLKPIILVPMGLLAKLPADQLEAILLHELAHIKRNDYVVNFVQNVAEAVFFFNPGLLWISQIVREERENCCDDIALTQTNDKRGFVQALISFKENEVHGSVYATAFSGKKNHLLRRVSRILNNQSKNVGMGEKVFFIASVLILAVLVTTTVVAEKTAKSITKVTVDARKKMTTGIAVMKTTSNAFIAPLPERKLTRVKVKQEETTVIPRDTVKKQAASQRQAPRLPTEEALKQKEAVFERGGGGVKPASDARLKQLEEAEKQRIRSAMQKTAPSVADSVKH